MIGVRSITHAQSSKRAQWWTGGLWFWGRGRSPKRFGIGLSKTSSMIYRLEPPFSNPSINLEIITPVPSHDWCPARTVWLTACFADATARLRRAAWTSFSSPGGICVSHYESPRRTINQPAAEVLRHFLSHPSSTTLPPKVLASYTLCS